MELGRYIDGRTLSYDEAARAFRVGDAPVSANQVRGYWQAGQITWAGPEVAAWFDTSFPTATTPPTARKLGGGAVAAIIVAVVIVILFGCGFFAAIAIPTFNAAKGSAQEKQCWAQERMVEGAAQAYKATTDAMPKSIDVLVSDGYLTTVPKCPTGGTYTFDATTGKFTCSQHGNYADPGAGTSGQ